MKKKATAKNKKAKKNNNDNTNRSPLPTLPPKNERVCCELDILKSGRRSEEKLFFAKSFTGLPHPPDPRNSGWQRTDERKPVYVNIIMQKQRLFLGRECGHVNQIFRLYTAARGARWPKSLVPSCNKEGNINTDFYSWPKPIVSSTAIVIFCCNCSNDL